MIDTVAKKKFDAEHKGADHLFSAQYREIIENLKKFLAYLEDKGIVKMAQYDSEIECGNLILDLMKLDLSKF